MDTKVTTLSRICNPIAEKVTRHSLVLPSFALPYSALTHDGYPNPDIFQIDQVAVRNEQWFTNQVGQLVFVASCGAENGNIKIENAEHAGRLHVSQDYGYKYLTLNEWQQQYTRPACEPAEPRPGHFYTCTNYLNGQVQEAYNVTYLGLTDNMIWYLFHLIDGPDKDGNQHNLLPVGCFPYFRKQLSPGLISFRQYTSVLTLKSNVL